MSPYLVALAFAALAWPLVVALARANELFCLLISAGRGSVVRGRIPKRLLDDVADVVARPPVEAVGLRAVNEGNRPTLVVIGSLGDAQRQRLRNVLGEWTVAQIRTAPRPRR